MSASSIPPVPPATTPPAQAGQVVQIQSLPDGLLTVSRAMHLEAEVVAQNADGSTSVRTAEGEMDLNIRGKQPQPGQTIEVDIPPGNPPRTVTVRPAPPQPLPQQPPTQGGQPAPQPNIPLPQTPATQPPVQGQTPQPQQPQPLPGQTTPVPVTGGQAPKPAQPLPLTGATTPVTVDVGPKPAIPLDGAYQPPTAGTTTPKSATAVSTPVPTLSAGQIIRMVPLLQPVTGSTPITSAAPDIILTPQTEKPGIIANMIAQKSQGTLVTSLLQAVKSALPSAISSTLPGTTIQTDGKTQITPSLKTSMATSLPNPAGILPVNEDGPIFQIPAGAVLEAKIVAIKSPTGQMQVLTPQNNAPAATPGIITPDSNNNVAAKPINITVNVTGFTAQKMPIIALPLAANAPVQNFVLQVQAPTLQAGSQLTLTPQITPATTAPITAMPPAWRALLPLMQPSSLWPAVDDIFQSFFQTTPQAAQILGRIIPSPANPSNMGPAIMLLAAAIRAGDLQGWMGEKKLEMLQKLGKGDLLSRLSNETSSLAGNNDTSPTDWKSVPVPILWQNEISKVLFHVRQEPQDDANEPGDIGTRFIFDLDLTAMGAVQLDGLLRGNRIDLIVRTKESISYPMQEAMKKAYADALDGTQIYGELGFQGDLKAWMHVVTGSETLNISM